MLSLTVLHVNPKIFVYQDIAHSGNFSLGHLRVLFFNLMQYKISSIGRRRTYGYAYNDYWIIRLL